MLPSVFIRGKRKDKQHEKIISEKIGLKKKRSILEFTEASESKARMVRCCREGKTRNTRKSEH